MAVTVNIRRKGLWFSQNGLHLHCAWGLVSLSGSSTRCFLLFSGDVYCLGNCRCERNLIFTFFMSWSHCCTSSYLLPFNTLVIEGLSVLWGLFKISLAFLPRRHLHLMKWMLNPHSWQKNEFLNQRLCKSIWMGVLSPRTADLCLSLAKRFSKFSECLFAATYFAGRIHCFPLIITMTQ